MIEPEDTNIELEFPPSRELVRILNETNDEDQEDDDDEDYEDGSDETEEDAADSDTDADELSEERGLQDEQSATSSPRHVKVSDTFEDADVSDTPGDDVEDTNGDDLNDVVEADLSAGAEDFVAELQGLINDTPVASEDLPSRKRKRQAEVKPNGVSPKSVRFEGFSSPAELTHLNGNGDLLNGVPENGSIRSGLPSDPPVTEANLETSDSGSSSDEESTSSSGSDASTDNDSEVETSSDESSDSGESTSSSESSLSSARSTTKAVSTKSLEDMQSAATGTDLVDVPAVKETSTTQVASHTPPGLGSGRTKRHNSRVKRKRILTRMKAEGKLPENANFQDLDAYVAGAVDDQTGHVAEEEEEDTEVDSELAKIVARKEEIFRRLNATTTMDVSTDNQSVSATVPMLAATTDEPLLDVSVASHVDTTLQEQSNLHSAVDEAQHDPEATPLPVMAPTMADNEPSRELTKTAATEKVVTPMTAKHSTVNEESETSSSKRAKLDLASSRRMVFNALGVRNPKSLAAEQALREKLSKPAREIKTREKHQDDKEKPAAPPQDFWKSKLTLSAVECGPEGGYIETPTFPFKHPWQVRKEKEKSWSSQADVDMLNHDTQAVAVEQHDTQEIEVAATNEQPSQTMTTSRTLTTGSVHEEDTIPIPSNFDILAPLLTTHLIEGTVVAYKELQINAQFEPEQSAYRTAKILTAENGQLQLQLSAEDREQADAQYDEETGQRIYQKFDMPTEDNDGPDDGIREMSMNDMIEPKLVRLSPSTVVIPESLVEQEMVVPEVQDSVQNSIQNSAKQGVDTTAVQTTSKLDAERTDLSSPRRAEIVGMMKEAGFDSALDDELLQPLPEPRTTRGGSTADRQSDQRSAQGVENEPEQDLDVALDDEHMDEADSWRSTNEPLSTPAHVRNDSSYVPTSSPQSESIIESVRYPHLPHLEFDTPSVAAKSSSHQDAQRTTSIPPPEMEEITILHNDTPAQQQEQESEQERPVDNQPSSQPVIDHIGVATTSSLPSEVQQTQFPAIHTTHHSEHEPQPTLSPLLQRDSSISPAHLKQASKPQPIKQEPSTHQNPRSTSTRTKALSTDWSDSETSGAPSQSQHQAQPRIKISASQREREQDTQQQQPRTNQSPISTDGVVDLTGNSPPTSKTNDGTGVGGRRTGSRVGSGGGAGAGAAAALRRSFEGLGERSFLKKKRGRGGS